VNLSQGHKGLICLKIDAINLEMYFPHWNVMNFAEKRLGKMAFSLFFQLVYEF